MLFYPYSCILLFCKNSMCRHFLNLSAALFYSNLNGLPTLLHNSDKPLHSRYFDNLYV